MKTSNLARGANYTGTGVRRRAGCQTGARTFPDVNARAV